LDLHLVINTFIPCRLTAHHPFTTSYVKQQQNNMTSHRLYFSFRWNMPQKYINQNYQMIQK